MSRGSKVRDMMLDKSTCELFSISRACNARWGKLGGEHGWKVGQFMQASVCSAQEHEFNPECVGALPPEGFRHVRGMIGLLV